MFGDGLDLAIDFLGGELTFGKILVFHFDVGLGAVDGFEDS
jgi:hypothetical protein